MSKDFITLYQRPASVLPAQTDMEYEFLLNLGSFSNTLIFPEYFTFHPGITGFNDLLVASTETIEKLLDLSRHPNFLNTMIVGGSIVLKQEQQLYNASPVVYNGKLLEYYFKRNLFLNESKYISRGTSELVLKHPLTQDPWGFLICADVNQPDYFSSYSGVKYIAIPVASPFLPDDTDEARLRRDLTIFQNGAQKSGAILFKCCLTGHTGTIDNKKSPVDSGKVQGRSLIAAPDQILARAPHIMWQGALSYSTLTGQVKTTGY